MRARPTAAFLTLAAVVAAPATASAQTFPDAEDYAVFACGDRAMFDRRRDESDAIDERDLVGDRGRAAGYHAADDEYLYLRIRLDRDPAPDDVLAEFGWGVAFDLDGDVEDYEVLVLVDGLAAADDAVAIWENTTTAVRNDPTDPAERLVVTYPVDTHVEVSDADGTEFGGDADHFLSFAVAWADLEPLGVTRDGTVGVWVASTEAADHLNGDFACHDGAGGDPSLSECRSDSTVSDPDVDSDGDGVSDADEQVGGTDPRDPGSFLVLAGGGGCAAGGSVGPLALVLVLLTLGLAFARRGRRRAAG